MRTAKPGTSSMPPDTMVVDTLLSAARAQRGSLFSTTSRGMPSPVRTRSTPPARMMRVGTLQVSRRMLVSRTPRARTSTPWSLTASPTSTSTATDGRARLGPEHAPQALDLATITHPDFQGRGLARRLMVKRIRRQMQRAESPFLHVMRDNGIAHRLYERMGFRDYGESVVRVVSPC